MNEKLVIIPSQVDEKLVINKTYKFEDTRCLFIYTLVWDKSNNNKSNNSEDQVMLAAGINCKVEYNKIIMNLSGTDGPTTILKRIDDYYFWKTENSTLSIYLVGLDYYDSIEFLNKISKNVPEKINIHDYYSASPDNECEFMFYDTETQKYKHYTKKDIKKLINDLNK